MLKVTGYQINEKIYSGDRNSIYRGQRISDSKDVVIKVMNSVYPSDVERLQFYNHYTIVKNLDINGVVKPLAFLDRENSYILVMEDVYGISLKEYINRRNKDDIFPLENFLESYLEDFLEIAIQLVNILDELIYYRIIHQNIKPSNILINPKTKLVKLIDFSLAVQVPKKNSSGEAGEICEGIDYRIDFHSLGVTFYEWLSGELLFTDNNKRELLDSHLTQLIPALEIIIKDIKEIKKIPAVISNIIRKLTANNPNDRYQSTFGLKYDLEKCLYQLKEKGKIEYFEIGKRDISNFCKKPETISAQNQENQIVLTSALINPHKYQYPQDFYSPTDKNEQRFQYLFEFIPTIAMQCYDLNRRVIGWNKASEILYGYSAKEAYGQRLEDLIIPSSMQEWVVNAVENWISQGIPIPPGELDLIRKDGSTISVYSTHILVHNSINQPEMYCFDIDISHRKQLERALLESEQKFRRLFEMTADAVMLLDKDGFIDCNSATLKIFGCSSKEDFCGKHPSEFSPPRQFNGVSSKMLAAKKIHIALKNGTSRFEWLHSRLDNSEFSAEVVLSRIELNGNIILQALVRDITKRKATEAAIKQKSHQLEQALKELQQTQLQLVQNEKMSALGNLVAGVAHEINNPVSFIAGNITEAINAVKDITQYLRFYQNTFPDSSEEIQNKAEELEIEYLLEDLPKMLNSMQVGCDRIISISTSLRTFSREDKDYKVLFDIHEGLESTILILKHRLKYNEKRPAINIITDYGDLPQIKCFPGQLNQVFMNIIANAIDALDESNQGLSFADIFENPNQITIITSLEEHNIKISIIDNGIGISPEIQTKIFDHLFTTKAVGKGTGLGLAIAHQIIVDKHGGSLQVKSSPGKGTEFAIALPIDDIN